MHETDASPVFAGRAGMQAAALCSIPFHQACSSARAASSASSQQCARYLPGTLVPGGWDRGWNASRAQQGFSCSAVCTAAKECKCRPDAKGRSASVLCVPIGNLYLPNLEHVQALTYIQKSTAKLNAPPPPPPLPQAQACVVEGAEAWCPTRAFWCRRRRGAMRWATWRTRQRRRWCTPRGSSAAPTTSRPSWASSAGMSDPPRIRRCRTRALPGSVSAAVRGPPSAPPGRSEPPALDVSAQMGCLALVMSHQRA